jgi:hypothetical protein
VAAIAIAVGSPDRIKRWKHEETKKRAEWKEEE